VVCLYFPSSFSHTVITHHTPSSSLHFVRSFPSLSFITSSPPHLLWNVGVALGHETCNVGGGKGRERGEGDLPPH
jgi:hypothetical protein